MSSDQNTAQEQETGKQQDNAENSTEDTKNAENKDEKEQEDNTVEKDDFLKQLKILKRSYKKEKYGDEKAGKKTTNGLKKPGKLVAKLQGKRTEQLIEKRFGKYLQRMDKEVAGYTKSLLKSIVSKSGTRDDAYLLDQFFGTIDEYINDELVKKVGQNKMHAKSQGATGRNSMIQNKQPSMVAVSRNDGSEVSSEQDNNDNWEDRLLSGLWDH